jgi:hypothetical protein
MRQNFFKMILKNLLITLQCFNISHVVKENL